MKAYPRFLTPELEPFGPLELAMETEGIVCRGDQRKYTEFYPFQGIQSFLHQEAGFHVASMSADLRFMDSGEKESLLLRLREVDPRLIGHLEEEVVDPYRTTRLRLRYAGIPAFSGESGDPDQPH